MFDNFDLYEQCEEFYLFDAYDYYRSHEEEFLEDEEDDLGQSPSGEGNGL